MTQFFNLPYDRHSAAPGGKLDVTFSIRVPGDERRDGPCNEPRHEHGDGHPHLPDTGVAAGTYPKVSVDAKGRVTAGSTLAATDIPALDWGKINSGKPTTLAGYGITDALPANATATAANKLASSPTLTATGDATWNVAFDGSANVSAPLTLANSGVAAGSYGSATTSAQVSVDGKGRITAAQSVPVTPAWGSVTDKPNTLAGYGITDALPANATAAAASKLAVSRQIAITGDATGAAQFDGSADVSMALTLAKSGVNAGDYGSGCAVPVISVNDKGVITQIASAPITTVDELASECAALASALVALQRIVLKPYLQ